jgi:hypothetical protein
MQLGISSANSGLYRNDAGSVYPYNIASVMNITGSSAGSPGYYYFYYNIEIEAECINTLTDVNNIHLEKNLLKIIDVLGREVNPTTNITLFYVYDDGSVMKKIIME